MPEVIMPKMGDGMESGTLLSWKKRDGDQVASGEVIAEIETDKSNVEIEAEDSGVLKTQLAEGQSAPVGAVIATIGDAETTKAPAASNGNGASAASNGSHAPAARPEIPEAPEGDVLKPEAEDNTPAVEKARPTATPYTGETVNITYREAIQMALAEELDRDPNVFLLGEEIGQYQGTFKITQGFLQKYGPERIVDTPISEAGMVGMTVGAAMLGLRPVLEFMTFNFALVAWDQIINHAAKISYMSGGQYTVPCVMRGPGGVGTQLSAQHSQDLIHWYANTPGLKVVAPATPADAKGLLKAAIRDNNPVIFSEHAKLYGSKGDVPTDPDFIVPIGVAQVVRPGDHVTIVGYSRNTILALQAAEKLAQEGIEAEVVDMRSMQPYDIDTILESVRKTHHAVVVHEQWPQYGVASEFAAEISEKAFDDLDAPVARVMGAFVPMPYSAVLEDLATPHVDHIVAAAKKTLERSL
jgi:pyruvate dehydrogenase E1 component beta subunit